jgi:hypothetical protein
MIFLQSSSDDTSDNVGTMVPDGDQTLVRHAGGGGDTAGGGSTADNGTMIQHATLVPDSQQPRTMSDLESDLGTMVINENDDDEDDDTMKRE